MLEVLDYSLGDSWKAIADRLKERFPTPPKVLISLAFALYQDGYKKRDRKEIEWAYWEIEGLRKCQQEVNTLTKADKEAS